MSDSTEKRHPASRAASPVPSAASHGTTRRSTKGSTDADSHPSLDVAAPPEAVGDGGEASWAHDAPQPSSALPPHMLHEAGIAHSSASGTTTATTTGSSSSSPPVSLRSVLSRPDSPGASSVTFVDGVGGNGGGASSVSRSSLRASSTASSTRSPSSEPRPSVEGSGGSSSETGGLRSALHRVSIDSGDDSTSRSLSAHTAPASSRRSRKAKPRIVSEGEELMSSRYERKVGFDTMPDADETNSGTFSFTLQLRSQGYKKTRLSRTFMCCVDDNSYSERALEWLMDSLVEDGDEIVALRVLEGEAEEIDQAAAREDARELLASIVQLNEEVRQQYAGDASAERGGMVVVSSPQETDGLSSAQQGKGGGSKEEGEGEHAVPGERRINVIVEFVAGKVEPTILRLIHMYRPCSLSVGTRGRTVSAFHKMLGGGFVGSTSRDILASSPVPVVVIRPEAKVQKHLSKRSNNPKRPRSYHELVAKVPEAQLPMSLNSRTAKEAHRKSGEWGRK